MWMQRAVNLSLAAYIGGLVASYAILLVTPYSLTSPTLAVYPFRFALGILIFTLPGSLWVAAIFRLLKRRWPLAGSYGLAVACGALTGGMMLWVPSPPSLLVFGIGCAYGFATASIWACINRYFIPAF
ncbi:hypothetical protein [Croceicoccus naphthovorans]|nr:hypothetical protein [Croceicoccus naphthovorans]